MDQSSQFDDFDPFFSPPSPLPTDASDAPVALSLPPEATYPSKGALFEAIQAWAKLRGYAFTTGKSKRVESGRQKVYYMCDRRYLPSSLNPNRIRNSRSRSTGCLFSVLGIETPSLGWEVRYRPDPKFQSYNYLPSQSLAAHPSYRCALLDQVKNTA
jgi:hypothetical protein